MSYHILACNMIWYYIIWYHIYMRYIIIYSMCIDIYIYIYVFTFIFIYDVLGNLQTHAGSLFERRGPKWAVWGALQTLAISMGEFHPNKNWILRLRIQKSNPPTSNLKIESAKWNLNLKIESVKGSWFPIQNLDLKTIPASSKKNIFPIFVSPKHFFLLEKSYVFAKFTQGQKIKSITQVACIYIYIYIYIHMYILCVYIYIYIYMDMYIYIYN
jgi:hypothetical protein